jgi:pilus assembly protein CpaF
MSLLDRMADKGAAPQRRFDLKVLEASAEAPAAEAPAPAPTVYDTPQSLAIPVLPEAKAAIHEMLVERHADEIDITDREGVRMRIASVTDEYVRRTGLALSRLDYDRMLDSLLDDVLGLGPLQPLIDDAGISEIMVNHQAQVFVERGGRILESQVVFESAQQLRLIIDRIVSTIGRRVDESSPMCDARLRDGSRVNVIIPPLALDGPCLTIRKFSKEKLRADDLVRLGSGSHAMLAFLGAAVRSKLNILISGGTGSGKTTLLNILSGFIPSEERIVTIEDAAELQLQQRHVIRLEARPANVEGEGAIEIRDLVRNALRMRPDRVVVGECRGGEALDMLQAMSTGHEGSMSTVHANTPRDALARLETMVLMAGTDLPARAILKQIASAVDVIVQTQRLRGGVRRIVSVAEVRGLADGDIELEELFQFRQQGIDDSGGAVGYHTATGARSLRSERFAASGEVLEDSLFTPVDWATASRG